MTRKPWLPTIILLVSALLTGGCGAVTQAEGDVAPAAPASPVSGQGQGPDDARAKLDQLVVKARGSKSGYSRDKFPHWVTVSGECDTRETVLKRDGQNVQTDAKCKAVSGTWRSPYDGATWTKASDVDIDHVVPLAQAWESGASSWTNERRKELANDLTRPQLLAVTDNVNQSKGDRAPDEWRPPLRSNWCEYATDWIEVKHYYQLTVTQAEKSALIEMLGEC